MGVRGGGDFLGHSHLSVNEIIWEKMEDFLLYDVTCLEAFVTFNLHD